MHDLRQGTCPLCQHNEIIEAVPRDFVGSRMCVMQYFEPQTRLSKLLSQPKPLGELTIYVCRGCGYVQWFAENPHWIPIDEKEHKTRLIRGPEPKPPYR